MMNTNNHLKRLYQFCENIHKCFYFYLFFFTANLYSCFILCTVLLNNPLTMNIILAKVLKLTWIMFLSDYPFFITGKLSRLWEQNQKQKKKKVWSKIQTEIKVFFLHFIICCITQKQLRVDYRKLLDIF